MDIPYGTWMYSQNAKDIVVTAKFLDINQIREFSKTGEIKGEREFTTIPMSKVQFVITKKIRFSDSEERYALLVLDSGTELYLLESESGNAFKNTAWENIFMPESSEDDVEQEAEHP